MQSKEEQLVGSLLLRKQPLTVKGGGAYVHLWLINTIQWWPIHVMIFALVENNKRKTTQKKKNEKKNPRSRRKSGKEKTSETSNYDNK